MNTVEFSVGQAIRKGKLFEVGLYPKQAFPYGPEEMKKTIENTKLPVNIVIEHLDTKNIPTPFDGKLGTITKLLPDAAFSILSGMSEWPLWMEEALSGVEKSVSCTFDRETYALKSVSLTVDPVVTDAALNEKVVAAFSKYAEEENTMTLEEVKQTFKDMFAEFSKPPAPVVPPVVDPPAPVVPPVPAAEFSALQEGIKTAQTELQAIREEGYRAKATVFAESVQNRLRPTDTKDLSVMFSELVEQGFIAIRDDAALGEVTFSRGTETVKTSRFAMLKSAYENLPPVDAAQELVGQALFSAPMTAEFAKQVDDEVASILSHGPYSHLADKGGK